MPRGDKSSYSPRQKRKAEHIEEGYENRGLSAKEAARRAWATVNKQDGGAQGSRTAKKKTSRLNGSGNPGSRSRKKSASRRSSAGSRSRTTQRSASH